MRILTITNLYPPHHAGSFDLRCESVVDSLRKRGHTIRVLTSNHGAGTEQRDEEIERRLVLNGVFDHAEVSGYMNLRSLETRNHALLRETVADFKPELVHVWSLHGLSKSLIFTLSQLALPTVFDVADDWMATGIRLDPWLSWWNCPSAPFLSHLWRRCSELTGQRNKIDTVTPTRMMRGYDRIPDVYGPPETLATVAPNSVLAFRFDHIYFCSQSLKEKTERAGFQVQHAGVIYPGVRAELFAGVLRPQSAPVHKLLIVTALTSKSGVKTAFEALRLVRESKVPVTLSVYGRGESDYIAQLRSFVVTHQLPVEFLTVSNLNRDLAAIYRQHDVFLYTSEGDEPFAPTLLEAMASGMPVIGARSGGASELLRHGENSFTYKPGDASDLATRIVELRIQPILRCQVAENAQEEVLSKFTENNMADQIEAFLEESRQG